MNELNDLLLQAEYDNVEFYGLAIQKMQQEIEVLSAHAIAAATGVRVRVLPLKNKGYTI